MGGNKTPIIDEEFLHGSAPNNWVEGYHTKLMNGEPSLGLQDAPERLRRITVDEASLLQSFPSDYVFFGSQSSIYKQIGNAVPPPLAEAVCKVATELVAALEATP